MSPSLPFAGIVCKLSLLIFCLCLVSVCTLAQGSGSQGATQNNNTAGPQPPSGTADGAQVVQVFGRQFLQAYGQQFPLGPSDTWTTQPDGTIVINHTEVTNGKIDPLQSYVVTVKRPEPGMPTTSTSRSKDGTITTIIGTYPGNAIAVMLNPASGGFNYQFFEISGRAVVSSQSGFVAEPLGADAADNALAHVRIIVQGAQNQNTTLPAPQQDTSGQTPQTSAPKDPSGLKNDPSIRDDIIKHVEKSLADPNTGTAPSNKSATPAAPNGVPTTSGAKTTSDNTQTKPYLQIQLQPPIDTINPPPAAGADKPGESVNISPLKVELDYKPNPSPAAGVRIPTKGVPDASTTVQPATGVADDFSGVNTANLPKSSGTVDFPPLAPGYKSKSLGDGGLLVENPEHQEFYYYLDGNNILQVQYVGVDPSSQLSNVSLDTSSFNDEESLRAHLRSPTATDSNGSSAQPAPANQPAHDGPVFGPPKRFTLTVRPGTLKIMGPIDIIPLNINLNDLIQTLIRFNPSETGSNVPGVSGNPVNQPEKSPTGTSQPGSAVRAKPRFDVGRGYTIDFGLRYSRFQANNPSTTVSDAVTKPDSSNGPGRTPSLKNRDTLRLKWPLQRVGWEFCTNPANNPSLPGAPAGQSSTKTSIGTETNCVNAFGPDPGSLRVSINSPPGVVFNPLEPHTLVCPIQGATLIRRDGDDLIGVHFIDCLPTNVLPSQIVNGSAVFTIGPSTEGLGVAGGSTERAATNEGGTGAGGGASLYPGFPALSAANSLLYGNLSVSLVVQITVVGEKVVATVSRSANASPSSAPSNASRLNPPQRSNDAEHSSSSDRARLRLASYHERPRSEEAPSRGPTVTPPAEGLIFSLASTGKLGTGAFEFRVHDPSGKSRNIELPEGTVLEPLNIDVPKPTGAPGGSDVTKSLTAFCLEIEKLPPNQNQLYRIAPPALQEKYKAITPVLQAGSKLAAEGKFHPDSEPEAYNDFTRQHAAWAAWLHWTEQEFTKVFLEHTKKNLEHMNVKWTKETEKALLAAAPGRWRDIQMVLDEADKLSNQSSH